MASHAAATAMQVMSRIVSGQIPVRHAGDAAELIKVLVDVARIEEGKSTSNVLHGSVNGELIEKITALQAGHTDVIDESHNVGDESHTTTSLP
jgi:hypothetical protein